MKTKSYLKTQRKKSFASLILAFLLMFTFNSSPILMLSENLRNRANAYKSTETQTYYAKNDSTEETKFSAVYPSSLKDYFTNSSENFNLLSYYTTQYDLVYKEFANAFYTHYFTSQMSDTQKEEYVKFFNNFMGAGSVSESSSEISVSELFTKLKNTTFAEETLEKYEFMYFAETLAYQGFTYYNDAEETNLTITPILRNTYGGKYKNLSNFYRLLANYSIYTNLDEGEGEENPEDENNPNNSIDNLEAFYNSNTHYLRLKKQIDDTIAKKTPLYAFDGETNNTYIASIFANMAPTTVKYNYISDSYDTYTTTTYSFEKPSGVDHYTIYYFGTKSKLDLGLVDASGAQTEKGKYYVWNNNTESTTSKEGIDLLYYVPVESGSDYINDENGRTYYKYDTSKTTTYPFVSNNNTPIVYVLNDDPTQSELDTYSSIFFNTIKSSDVSGTDNFYFQIPYEEDELYFKKVYNSLLYVSTDKLPADLSFTKFVDMFTKTEGGKTVSTLYLKYSTTNKNIVYVEYGDGLDNFDTDNPNYSYKWNGVHISDANDYVEITTSNGSEYLKDVEGNYKLYFKKTIDYYVSSTTNDYNGYETTFEPIKNLENHEVPSSSYEKTGDDRKLYILTEDGSVPSDLSNPSLTAITQTILDENSYYFVKVPTSLYPSDVDANTYTLYYKHDSTTVNKIYVVDDSDNAANNEVYKKYNFTVITSDDLKNNYSSFIALAEDDAHYDKNFKLYYRYERVVDDSLTYIEDTDGLLSNSTAITGSSYKDRLVGSDKQAQSEYVELDRENSLYSSLYSDSALLALIPDSLKTSFKLFYKYKNIFVQNAFTGENAIYVSYSGSSVGTADREFFTKNLWTPVKKTEIEANPDLYVALDKTIDPNYADNDDYTLYYKYIQSDEETKVVYDINDIDTTASDFDKEAYELVTDTPDNTAYYQAGKELYFKKLLTETLETYKYDTPTYYYYQTSSTVALSANSYYVISFYVQTHGNPADGSDVQASFVMKDNSNVISNISLDNISTGGKWKQYFIFVSTDATNSSNVNFYLYLGDEENGIKGSDPGATTVTGSVFFDEIKITKIGVSDFNKYAINDKKVYSTKLKDAEGNETEYYADEYNNQIFIANLEALKTDPRFAGNTYNNIKYIDDDITSTKGWNNMFNFDNATDDLKTLLGYSPKDEAESANIKSNTLESTLGLKDANGKYTIKGKDMYTSSFTNLWRYYISRDTTGTYSLDNYRLAYANGKLDVTITDSIEETKDDDDKDEANDEDDDDDDEKDYIYSSSPFTDNNFALKLTNKHKDISLGITSNAFTVKQYEYYKVTLWIYSPDKDGTATIMLNSVMKTEQENTDGSLINATISSVNANINKASNENAEFGWIPVSFYIEGNNLEDMDCYLVLQADKDCTVYFDNIHIEKITSSKFDTASSSTSDSYSKTLSLITSASNDSTSLKNGNFINVTVSDTEQSVNTKTPYVADNWTKISTSSSKVIAGVVSMYSNTEFFKEYNSDKKPTEKIIDDSSFTPSDENLNLDNKTNVYAIYAPGSVSTMHDALIDDYKHTYSIYSNSMSLSASSVYKISFKIYVGTNFSGNIISKLYLSSVKDENIISSFSISGLTKEKWQTITYYVATNTSSATVYLEIGIGDANGICFFKNADYEKLSSTMDAVLADVAKENNIASDDNKNLVEKLPNVKFLDMTSMSFGYRNDEINSDTNMFDQKVLTENAENSSTSTVGTNGVLVASYFDTTYTTTYSVTIDKTTYYIGEVYTATIGGTTYYVHKTYDAQKNVFNYALCSDSDLENEITKIGEDEVTITATADKVTLKVGSGEPIETTVTYRLYRFADLREEVKAIDDSAVSVPSLDKVIVGVGSSAKTNTTSSSQNASYTYHFGTDAKDFELNNTIIPASELENNQSSNVLILANNYKTDYISLKQSSTRTIGTSTQYVLRIYVKTSDFDSDDYGLNIKVDAVNVEWTNINTTNSKNKDDKGFVCYEVLIQSNSSDSITEFGVELSLGTKDNTGVGYAIISKVSLDTVSSADEFAHYSELVGDDNENIKKAIYANKDTTESDETDDEEEVTDDENSVSWATFFYIFSSLLLVVTMAIAMVALILKKHPIKFSQKYENDHDRDITTTSSGKKSRKKVVKNEVTIGEDRKIKKDNSGGIE